MRHIFYCCAVMMFILCDGVNVDAYVLPGFHVVNEMAQIRVSAPLRAFDAIQKTTIYLPEPRTLTMRLQVKKDGSVKLIPQSGQSLSWKVFEVADKGNETQLFYAFAPLAGFVFPASRQHPQVRKDILNLIRQFNIKDKLVRLEKCEDRFVYALGAAGSHEELWIDKKDFFPVKMIYRGQLNHQNGVWEVVVKQTSAENGLNGLPVVVDRLWNQQLYARSEILTPVVKE